MVQINPSMQPTPAKHPHTPSTSGKLKHHTVTHLPASNSPQIPMPAQPTKGPAPASLRGRLSPQGPNDFSTNMFAKLRQGS